jgi:hypothetical protein
MRGGLVLLAAALAVGCQTASAEPRHGSTTPAGKAPSVASATPTQASVRFHVEGMACERCSGRLRDGLRKLDGVTDVDADHQKKEVAVRSPVARLTLPRPRGESRNGEIG